MSTVAVIGLGEEGSLLASGLQAAGFSVVGFDIPQPDAPVVPLASSIEDAVTGADIVLSLNSPVAALRVAEQAAAHLSPGAIYADVNTTTPGMKKKLADLFPAGAFVDVAILGSLSDEGLSANLGAAGAGAKNFCDKLGSALLQLQYVSDQPGDAAARKLMLSFLTKAVTGAVIDTLWAAESLGVEEWTWDAIKHQFDSLDADALQKLLSETAKNFKRNQVELMDVVEMLNEAGYESTLAAPIQFNYGRIMHNKQIPFADPAPTQGTWTPPASL